MCMHLMLKGVIQTEPPTRKCFILVSLLLKLRFISVLENCML